VGCEDEHEQAYTLAEHQQYEFSSCRPFTESAVLEPQDLLGN